MTILLLFLFTTFNQVFISHASSSNSHVVTFDFPKFSSKSCSDGTLICLGTATSNDGYLSLTTEPQNGNLEPTLSQMGRVLYRNPVFAWPAIISTKFTFRISPYPNSACGVADGMTFVMAPDNSPAPPGSAGGYLGIFKDGGTVVGQLAVELDTYKNDFDIDNNHIGIDTTSITNPLAAKSLAGTGIDLQSGKDIKVQIDYNAWTNMLQVSMAYSSDPLVNILNQPIVLSSIVPQSVYVGFTAATGGCSESHKIIDWSFTSIKSGSDEKLTARSELPDNLKLSYAS
ncbi:leucoagglutinating phytohemagglutinin-like [Tripterygium wilfordii]|uniref:leucoagglutinating phytohemagglutinin-like n=1 Tax=Tripterygium wilfordii TaxID=458696 RepID=UPI0018F82949|nr:leucoagglutinating phytohemagglutinin-like [Tripterygium wilfordii]